MVVALVCVRWCCCVGLRGCCCDSCVCVCAVTLDAGYHCVVQLLLCMVLLLCAVAVQCGRCDRCCCEHAVCLLCYCVRVCLRVCTCVVKLRL